MDPAIACLEFISIARGIRTCDEMAKKASVRVIESTPICPGKYIVVIGGATGPVGEAYRHGLDFGGEAVVDELYLPNAHEQLFPAISAATSIAEVNALGVVETFSATAGILAADASCKRSAVQLIELRLARGMAGKAFYTMTGSVPDIETAIAAAEEIIGKSSGYLLRSEIIRNPHPDLVAKLM
jgi:microcompartment protein CcmL/EutN